MRKFNRPRIGTKVCVLFALFAAAMAFYGAGDRGSLTLTAPPAHWLFDAAGRSASVGAYAVMDTAPRYHSYYNHDEPMDLRIFM